MNKDVEKIELEAAKVRLQREQLQLQKELERNSRNAAILKSAQQVGATASSAFRTLWRFVLGLIAGLALWFGIGIFLTFKNAFDAPNWSFESQLGWTLSQMQPEWSIPLSLVIGLIWVFGSSSKR